MLENTVPVAWLFGSSQPLVPQDAGMLLRFRGTQLQLGTSPSVHIGGQSATIVERTADAIGVLAPALAEPGWVAVEFATSQGRSRLERGVGVLPLLGGDLPALPGLPFSIDVHASAGDMVLSFVSDARASGRLSVPPLRHGLDLALPGVLVLGLQTAGRDGSARLELPGLRWGPQLFFQALVLSSRPGYAPGSFTNVVQR